MYDVTVNRPQNRLYIVFKGHIHDVEADLVAAEVTQALDGLLPGFTIIADLSEAIPVSPKAAEHIRQIQRAFVQRGLKKAVRVVQNIVGAMQVKRIYEESGLTYDVIQVTSLEEAERILDEDNA